MTLCMQFFLKQILCLHITWDSFPILYQVCFVRFLQLLYLVPLCSVFSTVHCTVYRKCGFFLCCSIWAWLVAPRSWFQWLFTFAKSLLQKIIIWNCMYLWKEYLEVGSVCTLNLSLAPLMVIPIILVCFPLYHANES